VKEASKQTRKNESIILWIFKQRKSSKLWRIIRRKLMMAVNVDPYLLIEDKPPSALRNSEWNLRNGSFINFITIGYFAAHCQESDVRSFRIVQLWLLKWCGFNYLWPLKGRSFNYLWLLKWCSFKYLWILNWCIFYYIWLLKWCSFSSLWLLK